MDNNKSNRRRYTRVDFDASVSIQQHETYYNAELVDVSLKGMLVRLPNADIKPNQLLNITLTLSEAVSIHCQARWAHKKNDIAGLSIVKLDVDSMQHLCRLVQFNSGDQDLLDRDLQQLAEECADNDGYTP
ncbi:Cyclic diguanosine monophosphate-binding protein [BD1-7 clade bacterium]|uniref:Cyclic diguanosine monophosphate-binding protein n=1 Tax=BD1-7 clade bacterium TaxID=2029982 RepID=A0A5S9QDV9_9GAMM|nr:Cyclic diguanosine monophosphate-binding protein [BD1-7 clade bacterium]